MSYLRFFLFVTGITVAIGASAKMSPRTLERLADPGPSTAEVAVPEVAVPEEDEPKEVDTESPVGDVEISEEWPDTFPVFVTGILMATLGVVLWRWELRQERLKKGAHSSQDPFAMRASAKDNSPPLQPILEGIPLLEQFTRDAEQLRGWEIMRRVDQILETCVLPVVERRQEVMNHFGTTRAAEILIALAYGERMLNRAWSAAADGHLVEARSCLPEAEEGFREVRRLESGGGKPEA